MGVLEYKDKILICIYLLLKSHLIQALKYIFKQSQNYVCIYMFRVLCLSFSHIIFIFHMSQFLLVFVSLCCHAVVAVFVSPCSHA